MSLIPGLRLKKWTVPYGSDSWRQSLDRRISTASGPSSDQIDSIARIGAFLPDGFVCANDEIALALVQLLQSRDIQVPARCRVVGIDNTAASQEAGSSAHDGRSGKRMVGDKSGRVIHA